MMMMGKEGSCVCYVAKSTGRCRLDSIDSAKAQREDGDSVDIKFAMVRQGRRQFNNQAFFLSPPVIVVGLLAMFPVRSRT